MIDKDVLEAVEKFIIDLLNELTTTDQKLEALPMAVKILEINDRC